MKTDVFHLAIIPINKIVPHEIYDGARAKPLVGRLKKEKMLFNPIIVAPLANGQYIQLDGMNRLSAFKILKISSIVVQIVDYQDMDNVELSSWLHLFNDTDANFLAYIKSIPNLTIKIGRLNLVKNRSIQSDGNDRICSLISSAYQVHFLYVNKNLLDKVSILNQLVSFYHKKIIRDVLPHEPKEEDFHFLFVEHSNCNTMVVFPTFTHQQIIKVVESSNLFPPGITRHIIKRRCLNVNLPINLFTENNSINWQNKQLEKILSKRKFRLYEEPTIYFE